MRIIAIGICLSTGLLSQAAAAQQSSVPVTGQLQLIVTCPSRIYVTFMPASVPAGWSDPSGGITAVTVPFLNRGNGFYLTMPSTTPIMHCQYSIGSSTVQIGAPAPPGFSTCATDPNSLDKYICTLSPTAHYTVTP